MYTITLPGRSAAIIIENNKILLIQRIKQGYEYYTLPGGTIEFGETPEQAVIREVFEETSISAVLGPLTYHLVITNQMKKKEEFFFRCWYQYGTPQLQPGSIEEQRHTADNQYIPVWVDLDRVVAIRLYPIEVKELLLHDLKHGFGKVVETLLLQRDRMKQS